MGLEKEKKRKRRSSLVVALIAILLVTVFFLFRYTHQSGIGSENYSVRVEGEVCTVIVTETLPSKLRIDIDSQEVYEDGGNYTEWPVKNVSFYVNQEIESIPEIGFEEIESSILYHICLENYSFSWAMITFFELHYSEDVWGRDYLFQIVIREHFTSFLMEFETFKEDK